MSKFKKLLSQSTSGQSTSGQLPSGSPPKSPPELSLDLPLDRRVESEPVALEELESESSITPPPKNLTPSSGLPAPKKLSPQAYVATPGIPSALDLTKKAMPLKAVELKPNPSPDYIKVSIYLQRQTHRAVKQALLEDPEANVAELSDLIEGLLTRWLGSRR